MTNVDTQYKHILKDIVEKGEERETRSGTVLSTFGHTARFNISKSIPIITLRKVFLRGVIEELLWMISGCTNVKPLLEKGVNIWNADAERHYRKLIDINNSIDGSEHVDAVETTEEFLDNVLKGNKLTLVRHKGENYTEHYQYTFGDLGPVYGKNWRSFGENGIDQIANIIDKLKNNPTDRRIMLTGYNPNDVEDAALPPCHLLYQFYATPLSTRRRRVVANDSSLTDQQLDEIGIPKAKLSCMLYCRSQDLMLGTVFNWASATILTYMIAEVCNMLPNELIWVGGDTHVYMNQLPQAQEVLKRHGTDSMPTLRFKRKITSIDDFHYDDFIIENYEAEEPIKIPLSVSA